MRTSHYLSLKWIRKLLVYQNCNIGSLLLEKAKEFAKSKGINKIELKVFSFNKKSIEFYYKKGFKDLNKSMYFDL